MATMKEVPPPPATFRVLFSDGDREIDVGEVVVDPGLTFQKFQFLIGDMVGVSSHQIKLFLLRQKKARSGRSPREIWRKTPVGEGTDFAVVAREKGCAVLAQMKGTRKDRRRRGRRDRACGGTGGEGDGFSAPEKKRAHLPEEAFLRRQVEFHGGASATSIEPVAEEIGAGLMGLFHYEGLRNPRWRREGYLLSTAAAAYYRYAGAAALQGYDTAGFGGGCDMADVAGAAAAAAAACVVCSAAAGRRVPFHWCVYDRVVAEGFRSSAGPIQRPRKSEVHALA